MLLDEIDAIQNPALGATLIWRAVWGFYEASGRTTGCPALLAFIILPVLFNEDLRTAVSSTYTSSGIQKFESKFGKQIDLLFSIQERASSMRDLSRRSLSIGLSRGLLALSPDTALLWPRSTSFTRAVPRSVIHLTAASERLGAWVHHTSLREVCFSLRLEL